MLFMIATSYTNKTLVSTSDLLEFGDVIYGPYHLYKTLTL